MVRQIWKYLTRSNWCKYFRYTSKKTYILQLGIILLSLTKNSLSLGKNLITLSRLLVSLFLFSLHMILAALMTAFLAADFFFEVRTNKIRWIKVIPKRFLVYLNKWYIWIYGIVLLQLASSILSQSCGA